MVNHQLAVILIQTLSLCCAAATSQTTLSAPTCPAGWTLNGNRCYLMDLTRDVVTWTDCKAFCGSFNGHMLCIEDQAKNEFILDHMGTLRTVWLSYNDQQVAGTWQWAPECPNTGYTNWDLVHNEPSGVNEHCAELYGRVAGAWVGWNDSPCDGAGMYCFCEGSAGDSNLLSYGPTQQPSAAPTESPCAQGYHSETGHHPHCKRCKKGTTTAQAGATVCDQCADGFYGKKGMVPCRPCPRGYTTTEEVGHSMCVACVGHEKGCMKESKNHNHKHTHLRQEEALHTVN